jgi:N-methylhydantoinase A
MRRLAAVDVGGTFTDIAVWDSDRQAVTIHKLLTTPDDPTRAIVDGLGIVGMDNDALIHATTLVTNALIERRGAVTGLVTTEGYRDVLEIGKELRYDSFDLFMIRPDPLVPRRLRLPVRERVASDGTSVEELDEAGVLQAGRILVGLGVESVAVAFFNSYRNPEHERRAVRLLLEAYPRLAACSSAEVAPEIREYERFSTAVANAYIQPLASRYLLKLADVLGIPLFVMLSDGGITTARWAAEHPIALVESGPAAGAMAAAHITARAGWSDVIAFDMGGTTAKISLNHGGVPQRTHEMEVARVQRFKKGSGLPLRVPVVEMIEIGAGGGSIASVGELGLLKVGPRSAGAVPGPACYARGGTEPTVTDADLYLGYLSPESFLGGRMKLDLAQANAALDRVAEPLGLDRTAVAAGIIEIVNNHMATAARAHIAEHGRDPRSYRIIGFGGAGPVHAYRLARLLHIKEVVFPRGAGVASALGMLVAPRSVEFTRSLVFDLEDPDWDAVTGTVRELESQAQSLLDEAQVRPEDMRFEVTADVRYVGQGFEITVPIEMGIVDRRDTPGLAAAFEDEYRRRFDRILHGAPAEVISWRLRALSESPVSAFPVVSNLKREGRLKKKGMRPAYFAEAGGFVATAVYERSRLRMGDIVTGPALIEESESTVVVGPAGHATVDESSNVILTIG